MTNILGDILSKSNSYKDNSNLGMAVNGLPTWVFKNPTCHPCPHMNDHKATGRNATQTLFYPKQLITSDASNIRNSNFRTNRKTRIIIHGFIDKGEENWLSDMCKVSHGAF
jgi:hypothetical protein